MELICLQIDLARQKENSEYIKSYIDFAKENGYNSLLVYLENAVRTENTEYFKREETYSKAEIAELVNYGESKGVELIPAFENLGHLEKFMAYPQLSHISECEDAQKEGRALATGLGTCGCTQKPELYAFLDKYITEVASLFKSKYVHMGLDEPFDFAVCERCRAEMEKGASKAELFYRHVMHSYELIKGIGKTMMMWDDFFQYADIVERLPREIVFCNWNYYFIGEEPGGHWTNRIKRDWFAYYDKLGFRYMLCTYASSASSTYNVDSFTDYAAKYRPMGALMTAWERSQILYLGMYPLIAYAGKKWNGEIKTEEDKVAIYAKYLGSTACAEVVLSLQIPSFYWGNESVGGRCENDYYLKMLHRDQLKWAVKALASYLPTANGLQKDVLSCIYNFVFERYLGLLTERLGGEIFDHYEAKTKSLAYFTEKLDEIAAGYAETESSWKSLWEKYRKGIVSCKNSFAKKYEGKRAMLEQIKADIAKNEGCAVVYADMMMHDGYGTPRADIRVKYEDEAEESVLYQGGVKGTYVGFELGGCYTLRFAAKKKKIEWLTFTAWGEDALYPTHFRYTLNGNKYVVATVETLSGKTENVENLLYNDTRFASVGFNDGLAHFNDIGLCKTRSTVKVTFKQFI